ncbi:hypothetical protein NB717_001098 [Xanthomonas sacchari]|nr:hypothetical protein [Xanthomonas sacchari]
MPAAPVAQLGLGQVLVRLPVTVPQAQDADEFRARIGELGMRVVGGLARLRRALARVLDAQERGDHQHRSQAAVLLRRHQHPRQFHVHRQPRHLAADLGQLAQAMAVRLADRPQLHQLLPAIGHRTLVRRLQKREILDPSQPQLQHAQDHPGQAGAADLRIGELRPRRKIRLGVQPVADALGDAAAAALALVGAGLRDRFDVQAIELLPRAVALDPRIAGIDHVADARHRQRGFGDVGGQHQAPPRPGVEHPVLVGVGEPRVQRQHLGLAVLAPFQRMVRIADLAFAGQEHQHVAARIQPGDFVDRRHDRIVDREAGIGDSGVGIGRSTGCRALAGIRCFQSRLPTLQSRLFQGPVAHLHRIGAALHADHRRVVEMRGEARGVDRRRGHDDLQVQALAQQLLQVAEQEIDVEAALVRLVDDDRVVAGQPAVAGDLGQQDAVGHELDPGLLADAVVEAHLEAHRLAHRRAQLLGHAAGHRARGDAPWLGAADHAGGAAPGGQAQLRQLRGLARTGLAGDHHHLVLADQRDDALGLARDRQLRIQGDRRLLRRARGATRLRRLQRLLERRLQRGIAGRGLPARP